MCVAGVKWDGGVSGVTCASLTPAASMVRASSRGSACVSLAGAETCVTPVSMFPSEGREGRI